MMTAATDARFFQIGGLRADVTHLWKTHPMLSGARRFSWIYRVCRLVAVDGDVATIRMTGLKSRPLKKVPACDVIELPGRDEVKTLPLSA